ncbi:MAG: low molecular weight phosphotyrosine protein phosphatase, partial [Gammaproteobacteria bacterium]
MKILFVCMGNICRSPTAEGVVRARLLEAVRKHGSELDIELDSAG